MRTVLIAFATCGLMLGRVQGEAEPRTALLMGVGKPGSERFADLPGIDKDLANMSTALKQVGFSVTVVSDPTLVQAETAIDDFGTILKVKQGVGLFYFSGHGGEYEGKNYLIPRGARLGDVRDIKEQAVAAQRVLNRMEASGARVNIVFLDCCRNDMTKAATDTGLAAMSARGTFIGFATASEKTSAASADGSPYTKFLVKNLLTPGLSILDMHTQVTAQVQDFTKAEGAEQVPFSYSGLRSPFYFVNNRPEDSENATAARRGTAALAEVPRQLTLRQQRVLAAPALGKVSEFQSTYGFVVITIGTKRVEKGMVFALRRGSETIGRIKINEVAGSSAVADVDVQTIPAGVSIQVGDDVIPDISESHK